MIAKMTAVEIYPFFNVLFGLFDWWKWVKGELHVSVRRKLLFVARELPTKKLEAPETQFLHRTSSK